MPRSTVRGARQDLHSGTFGGAVANPLNALAVILASLKGPDGRILIPGFYDDVVELRPEERGGVRDAARSTRRSTRQDLGAPKLFGETGYTQRSSASAGAPDVRESTACCRACTGEGAPDRCCQALAMAKVSMPLVFPDQDPREDRRLCSRRILEEGERQKTVEDDAHPHARRQSRG